MFWNVITFIFKKHKFGKASTVMINNYIHRVLQNYVPVSAVLDKMQKVKQNRPA